MLSSKAILAALKWVVLWSLLAAFTALLTLIFSFLGAIFCAALAGMMSGAIQHSRWHSLPLAAVFPGVLWLVLRVSKAELLPHQVHVLMVVCFATFWFTYALSWAVVAYERKGRQAPGAGSQPQPARGQALVLNRANGAAVTGCPSATVCLPRLTLRNLQGQWRHHLGARQGPEHQEVIEIADNHLTLSAIGPDGQVRCSFQGEFKVEGATCMHGLAVSACPVEWPADLSVCI